MQPAHLISFSVSGISGCCSGLIQSSSLPCTPRKHTQGPTLTLRFLPEFLLNSPMLALLTARVLMLETAQKERNVLISVRLMNLKMVTNMQI